MLTASTMRRRIRAAAGGIVIVVANTKGGAGKSTTAWGLAHAYAAWGLVVLIIDADGQASLVVLSQVRAAAGLPELVRVIAWPNPTLYRELAGLAAGVDVVIVDGPRSANPAAPETDPRDLDCVITAGMAAHGMVLIPVPASPMDVRATERDMAGVITAARKLLPDLLVRTVLVRGSRRERITETVRVSLAAGRLGAPLSSELDRRTVYVTSLVDGRSVAELDPGGMAAIECDALAREAAYLILTHTPETR